MYYFTFSKSIENIKDLKFYEMPSIAVRESCTNRDISKKFCLCIWNSSIKDYLSTTIHTDDINKNYSYSRGIIKNIEEFEFKPISKIIVNMNKTIMKKSGWNNDNCHIVRGWESLPKKLLDELLATIDNDSNVCDYIKDEITKMKLVSNKNINDFLYSMASLIFSARNIRNFSDDASETVSKMYKLLTGKIDRDNISTKQLNDYINNIEHRINKKFIGYQSDDIEFAGKVETRLDNIRYKFKNHKKFYELIYDSYYSCIDIMYDGDIPSNAFHEPTPTVTYYNMVIKLIEPLLDIVEEILDVEEEVTEINKINNVFHKDENLNKVHSEYLLSYHNPSISQIGEEINIVCNKFKDIATSSGNNFIFYDEYKNIYNNLSEILNNYKKKYCPT